MKNRLILLYTLGIFIGLPVSLSAQKRISDSLTNVLKQNDLGSHERAMTMSRLADALSFDDLPLAMEKNREAILYAGKSKDKAAMSYAYSCRAVYYVFAQKIDIAQKMADSAVFLAQKASPLIKGIAWYRKGYVETVDNNPEAALKDFQTALNNLGEPDGALYRSGIFYSLYGIYAERSDVTKATDYARLSLEAALQSKEPSMLTAAWQINGTNFLDHFSESKDSVLLDSAVNAFRQSVTTFQQQKDWIKNKSVVVLSALNLAEIYMDYYPPWYKDSILQQVNLALDVSYTMGNRTMQANCYDIISKLNRREGNLSVSEKALLKEKEIIDSINPPNNYLYKNLYESLATVKEEQGDKAGALANYKKYLQFYQKIFDAEQLEGLQKLEAKYENEKKDKELKLLQQRNAFQKKQTYLYIGIALIAIAGLLFLFLAYHFRLKYSLQREKLKDEEAARLLAEQKLMQSQKEQLQKEILAGALHVEHKNALLLNLKDKLIEHADAKPIKQLEKIINEEIRMDEDFESVKSEFKDLHPDFFTRLQQKATQKLTPLDLKYCAYLYMKLSSKQIAALLHVEPKSVRMTKYRLKQKLGLGKDEDLDIFLHSKAINP